MFSEAWETSALCMCEAVTLRKDWGRNVSWGSEVRDAPSAGTAWHHPSPTWLTGMDCVTQVVVTAVWQEFRESLVPESLQSSGQLSICTVILC